MTGPATVSLYSPSDNRRVSMSSIVSLLEWQQSPQVAGLTGSRSRAAGRPEASQAHAGALQFAADLGRGEPVQLLPPAIAPGGVAARGVRIVHAWVADQFRDTGRQGRNVTEQIGGGEMARAVET